MLRKTNPAKLSHSTSISSGEKEVSHGREEGKEEEDVEVTSTSASLAWGRALASYFARRCGTLSLAPRYDFGAMAGPWHLVLRSR